MDENDTADHAVPMFCGKRCYGLPDEETMRDGLKPEVRVNINGVPVIKHVRSGDSTSSKNRLLAVIAPSLDRKLADKAERRFLVNHFVEALEYWSYSKNTSPSGYFGDADLKKRYCDDLSKYSIESLRYIASACDTSASFEDQDKVMQIITNRSGAEKWVVVGIRYRQLLGDPRNSDASFFQRLSTVEIYFSENTYLAPAEEGTDEHDFNVKVVSFALRLTDYIQKSAGDVKLDYDNPNWVDPVSHDLVSVLRDYPGREDDIVDFMRDRSLAPYMVTGEMLRNYLAAPSAPLRAGSL